MRKTIDTIDSFPHALELSKQDYNAFALIYHPGAQIACKDLAKNELHNEICPELSSHFDADIMA